jgi:hypothetical protein
MIYSLIGRQGEGKTVSSIFVAKLLSQLLDLPIHTNIKRIEGVNTPQIRSFTQLNRLRNCVVLLDELHHDLDARKFKENAQRTQWASHIRKYKQILVYNSQQFKKIDLRLRDETYYVVNCQNTGTDLYTLTFYDAERYEMNLFVPIIRFTVGLKALYSMYDTMEVVGCLTD